MWISDRPEATTTTHEIAASRLEAAIAAVTMQALTLFSVERKNKLYLSEQCRSNDAI